MHNRNCKGGKTNGSQHIVKKDSYGLSQVDLAKLLGWGEATISYIAEKVSNLFKVKLMKMLWYSDILSFIENGSAMTGMVYRCRTDFADIQNKKECGGNRQWQRRFLRKWVADMKSKAIT